MRYMGRELRRMFLVEVYEGDPDKKKPKTRIESVIAWNTVDAIRRCGGKAAALPVEDCFVTWDDKPLVIQDTSGPTDEEVKPTIEAAEDDWV